MTFLLPIIYAALAGVGLSFGIEAAGKAKIKPGSWIQEMRAYEASSVRMRPCIGRSDPQCFPSNDLRRVSR